MGWEVDTIGIDIHGDPVEEVYTTCATEEEANRAAMLLRQSMVPFVIVVREFEDAA